MEDNKRILLGVNIDHIATIRQARGTRYPDPLYAAQEAESAGADGITVHLREDLRHIQERDVRLLRETILTRLNLEMALTPYMLDFACEIKPDFVCIVPEKREELTTEGGLDVISSFSNIKDANKKLATSGVLTSLFIDPQEKQIKAAQDSGAKIIELHTGRYADSANSIERDKYLQQLTKGAELAADLGLRVNAGHGLNYQNLYPIIRLPYLNELNIGHSIVARALFVGMHQAVAEMKRLLEINFYK